LSKGEALLVDDIVKITVDVCKPVERVVLNALAKIHAVAPPDYLCSELLMASSSGEADRPLAPMSLE
jgi:hypothetical protein